MRARSPIFEGVRKRVMATALPNLYSAVLIVSPCSTRLRNVAGKWRFGDLFNAEQGSRVDRDFLGTHKIPLSLDGGGDDDNKQTNKHSFIPFSSVRTFNFARREK